MTNASFHILFLRWVLVCLCGLLFYSKVYSQDGKKEWLNKLRNEIQISQQYDLKKTGRIDSLRKLTAGQESGQQFDHFLKLYDEYAVFNFDSAYYYARNMQETAKLKGDTILEKRAAISLNSVLLSSGMFKEVFESLGQVNPEGLDRLQKAGYYVLMARSYFDLADYNRDNFFSDQYSRSGDRYIDSCLLISDDTSFRFLYYNGLKSIRAGDIWKATDYFRKLNTSPYLSLHEQAIINSTFSDIYIRRGILDSAIILMVKAAIADIHSSTKETTAILHLATLLFKQGDIENASIFIQKAALDAKTYGARQRMVQLSNVLPLIEGERLAIVEKEKSGISKYATIITISFILLIVLILVVIRQMKKLKRQRNEIRQKNTSLHHLVEEKEWLIKEIHHRVKNNLHTITSLLESQSAYLENDALQAIRDSQHRVFAMSLIHQKLYQPESNESGIDMSIYIREMVNYLKESFETGQLVRFQMDLEPVYLDISLAVPMGLILNEAITNSLKYAFPERKGGLITVSIKRIAKNNFLFTVTDDGIGLPAGFDSTNVNSLGMKLMKGLSDELSASFRIENKRGTRISIEFVTDKFRQDNRVDGIDIIKENKA